MQEQMDVGASFTTTRARPTVVAVITTLIGLALVPRDLSYTRETLHHRVGTAHPVPGVLGRRCAQLARRLQATGRVADDADDADSAAW